MLQNKTKLTLTLPWLKSLAGITGQLMFSGNMILNIAVAENTRLQLPARWRSVNKAEVIRDLEEAVRELNSSNTLNFNEWHIDFLTDYIVNVHRRVHAQGAALGWKTMLTGLQRGIKRNSVTWKKYSRSFPSFSAVLYLILQKKRKLFFLI